MFRHNKKKHSAAVRRRAFMIWQQLGVNPWARAKAKEGKKGSGDFYKGAFDSIPFLNDDAKRTFVHLLLRPGYMIRDYIKGEHEKYLAPLTSLIIFYAFFALISSVLQPIHHNQQIKQDLSGSELFLNDDLIHLHSENDSSEVQQMTMSVLQIVQRGYIYLHLDQYPEEVHTQSQASLAAFESALRSQGIPLFIGYFIILWLAMSMSLKRRKLSMSACAVASAYILCQFSFFMLFAVILSWGKSTSIGAGLMLLLLVVDYRQWLGLSWPKSIKQALSTAIFYLLVYLAIILAVSALVVIIAVYRN